MPIHLGRRTTMLAVAIAVAGVAFVYLLGFVSRDRMWFPADYLLRAKSHVWAVATPRGRKLQGTILTVFLRLRLNTIQIPVSRPGDGGALTSVGEDLLVLTHEGTVFAVTGTSARKTRITLPDNGFEAYKAAAASEK